MMKTCGKLVDDKEETEILKEVEGLGTEATRSGIIETIKRHNYINVTKNVVTISDKGRVLCQAIEGNLLSSPSMTAKWETYLRKIGNGEGTQERFLGSIAKFIHSLLDEVPSQLEKQKIDVKLTSTTKTGSGKNNIAPCPTCKQGTIIALKGFMAVLLIERVVKKSFLVPFLRKSLNLHK